MISWKRNKIGEGVDSLGVLDIMKYTHVHTLHCTCMYPVVKLENNSFCIEILNACIYYTGIHKHILIFIVYRYVQYFLAPSVANCPFKGKDQYW